jgi:PadR family transcriptional regulator AphA
VYIRAVGISRELLPGEYAVLGLLAGEPAHGYEVARHWAESALAMVCPVEQATVYAYLQTLEREQLVDWEEQRVGRRPPRRVYTVNEAGWSVLRAWLRAPVQRMREVRLDFLLKLFLLERIDPGASPGLIRDQIAACRHYVHEAESRSAAAEGFELLLWESKRSAGEATLNWLESHRSRAGRTQAS